MKFLVLNASIALQQLLPNVTVQVTVIKEDCGRIHKAYGCTWPKGGKRNNDLLIKEAHHPMFLVNQSLCSLCNTECCTSTGLLLNVPDHVAEMLAPHVSSSMMYCGRQHGSPPLWDADGSPMTVPAWSCCRQLT